MNPNTVTTTGGTAAQDRTEPALRPAVDVFEDSTGITLVADLPGVPRDKLQLRVEGDTLDIEAEMALPAVEGLTPSHVELPLARYRRSFTLSKELDPEQVSAELSQGVLRVRIPKTAQALPRRINVQVA
ncbi:MAG: Hsp20/alpha crystallin family protein [Rubrivivax sp.]|nr:Hsp20/alpha crystallin family protein [Rubrivivax sp.]